MWEAQLIPCTAWVHWPGSQQRAGSGCRAGGGSEHRGGRVGRSSREELDSGVCNPPPAQPLLTSHVSRKLVSLGMTIPLRSRGRSSSPDCRAQGDGRVGSGMVSAGQATREGGAHLGVSAPPPPPSTPNSDTKVSAGTRTLELQPLTLVHLGFLCLGEPIAGAWPGMDNPRAISDLEEGPASSEHLTVSSSRRPEVGHGHIRPEWPLRLCGRGSAMTVCSKGIAPS